jgi:hypothetical protein
MRLPIAITLAILPVCGLSQSQSLRQGVNSIEIKVERLEGAKWKSVDPSLVFAKDDRIRLHFRTNFDGYVYVTDKSTSGKYEQLFPRAETGRNNRVEAGTEYTIPATDTVFRVAGPPGHDVIYWLMSPVALTGGDSPYRTLPPPPSPDQQPPAGMTPRCDGEIFRARGECLDSSAGPQGVALGERLPENLTGASRRDLLFLRKQDSTVVSSTSPLAGPVIYEFRLAHK